MIKELFNTLKDRVFPAETKAAEERALMGNADPELSSIAGSAVLNSAKTYQRRQQEEDKEKGSTLRKAERVRKYLERIDQMIEQTKVRIAELTAQRAEALRMAQEAFDRAHEAEDLLAAIQDGVSADERQRLIELLGVKAKDASQDELTLLLQKEIDEGYEIGREQSNIIDDLTEKIRIEEERLNELQETRSQYRKATSEQERLQIEEHIDNYMPEVTTATSSEEFTDPNYEGLGLPLR